MKNEKNSVAKKTLSVKEAAQRLGCSVELIYSGVRRNEIPHLKVGRKIFIPTLAFERLIATGHSRSDKCL
jgi:excisionase family DNA binding protein